jgi:uncharacterized protein
MIENHSLALELPEFKERIHEMKTANNHVAKLFNSYHEVDKEIKRFETEVEVTSDDHLEELKKQRLHLKDQLYAMLTSA